MNRIELTGLRGQNTLGFLAALGLLVLAEEANLKPKLSWTDDINQNAIISVNVEREALRTALLDRLDNLAKGALLNWGKDAPVSDVKFTPNDKADSDLRLWIRDMRIAGTSLERRLLGSLLAEGAVDGKGTSKPSHLHFAAGQQQFLDIARDVLAAVASDNNRLDEAIFGPWRFDGDVKNFGWASGTERIFAVRGFKPSGEKRLGVPGADALAFVGLSMFPVVERNGSLLTAGCARGWKSSSFSWMLWKGDLTARVVGSLMTGAGVATALEAQQRGIVSHLEAPIRRTDQGGYGSFGAPQMIASKSRDHYR
jgi:hypothetical protein